MSEDTAASYLSLYYAPRDVRPGTPPRYVPATFIVVDGRGWFTTDPKRPQSRPPCQGHPMPTLPDLDHYRAETERLKTLIDFLSRPVQAHGGTEPDADVISAYNLAVEGALKAVRRAAGGDA